MESWKWWGLPEAARSSVQLNLTDKKNPKTTSENSVHSLRMKTAYVSSYFAFRPAFHGTRNGVQASVFRSMENSLAGDDVSHDHRLGSFINQPHIWSKSLWDKLSSPALAAGYSCICTACCGTKDPALGVRVGNSYHCGRLRLPMDEHYLIWGPKKGGA